MGTRYADHTGRFCRGVSRRMREHVKQRIDSAVFYIYKRLGINQFPITPRNAIRLVGKCRYMSYEKLAAVSNCGLDDVIHACRSADGCTHYDRAKQRYLILVNEYGRNESRVRWTCAHEIGHIVAGHFQEEDFMEHGKADPMREEEADYFSASFLCPLPAIPHLFISSSTELADCFGLSGIASERRWSEFLKKQCVCDDLTRYFNWNGTRTTGRKPRLRTDRAIDIWPDDETWSALSSRL